MVSKMAMSAPAMNIEPDPMTTIASTPESRAGAGDRGIECRPHRSAERVHRRVVDREDGDAIDNVVVKKDVHAP